MKMKHLIKIISISVLLLALFGCPLPIQETETLSTLTLNFSVDGGARTLLPEIDMDVADYDVTGTGPDGASFEIGTSAGSVEVPGLAFGEWTVVVQANNADGTVIARGEGTTTVHTGENSTLNITVTPLDGYGTIDLTLLWNAEDTEIPSIEAQLIPSSGPAVNLDFTITGGNTSTFTSSTIPTGYHTLTLKLLDNGLLTMGAVEVVRIVKDQTTSGTFEFYDINEPGGNIQINITPEMADPLLVLLSGAAATKPENQSMALSASVSGYTGNVTYVWFVNGDSISTGETFSFDNSWAQGYYRIDVTAYSVDGTQAGSDSVFIEVTEPAAATGFQTVWKTDNTGASNDNQITLPLVSNGTYDFTVNWGDGNSDTITTYNQAEITHTYAAAGTYDVSISGEIVGWSFGGTGDSQKLLEVTNWGSLGFGNTHGQFYGCQNLTVSAVDKPNLTDTTSLYSAFFNCFALINIPAIDDWDTSGIMNMSYMFYQATAFNGDIFGWDTSGVTNMSCMFYQATAFNADISGWDTTDVTNMSYMFWGATSFNNDLSAWDVSNVTDMSYMFDNVTLSTANYDALLIGWEGLAVQDSVPFHGGNSQYSAGAATEARQRLIDDHSWTITDGGQE